MQYPDPAQLSFNFPGHGHSHSHDIDPRGLSTSNTQVHPNGSATNPNPTSNNIDGNSAFLFPFPPRSRRKSDTDLHPPHWANMNQDQQFSGNDGFSDGDNSATVNLSDILPSQQQHQSTFVDPTQSPHNFTFGPPSSTNYLSPDMNQLRRSKSDSGSRPGHQRQSRSEDIYSTHGNVLLPYPPSSQQEFISRQFLHPQEGVPPSFRGNGGREHARRASSGSRGIGGIGGVVEGSWSGASSSRPSPYPSPSASPRYRADELPGPGLTTGRQAPVLQHDMHDMNIGAGRGMEVGAVVSKPNVTTGRTANASRIRRKQEANFMCPVPGCGSTFTRSFNLKGAPDLPYSKYLCGCVYSCCIKVTCGRIMRRSHFSASGQDVAKVSRDSTIASGMSSCIPTIGRSPAMDVTRISRGWTLLTGIVSFFPLPP